MTPPFSQTIDVGLLLAGVVLVALALTVIALGVRSRWRRGREALGVASLPREPEPVAAPKLTALDGAALMAAVKEAEADGQSKHLPGLYLSLARWRLDSGETSAAAELLRKSILGATTAGQRETHANARVALGDIAQTNGDPVTACEHWQIARSLFRELRQEGEHDAVEARMRRNGCPTDWVLTDF
jgi:hypothetical protein